MLILLIKWGEGLLGDFLVSKGGIGPPSLMGALKATVSTLPKV